MTRKTTGTIFIICALLTLMALGGLSRYQDAADGKAGDWETAGEKAAKEPEKSD